ncbi:PLP-dependent aminotransferase family protein [Albimonas pacifica]|uniref:Transcriptional regulator, GntR family n=1 Tax=Albimonas pacifica TaxID=1114924 RepID=A0A1I3BP28_9RHOB|nr:PLP-dependent aminotransferase family protein [Albimonas pacifica]SFH64048.1 transcriptional regulator, GntR family [Albimonas pacifica]
MTRPGLVFDIDRSRRRAIADQIAGSIRAAIGDGRLPDGARLPSWVDLAAQLGVARGTVRRAYEILADEQLVIASGASGTLVAPSRAAERPAASRPAVEALPDPMPGMTPAYEAPSLPFQNGVPAQEAYPVKVWARLLGRAARARSFESTVQPDPRGDPGLRAQIAAHLAVARGIACAPDQVVVTTGFRAGLTLAIAARARPGAEALVEDPGFPVIRRSLEWQGLRPVASPVDAEGLDVARAVARAPEAALAVVSACQHAPLGSALSPARRRALLDWADRTGAWIIEDDFLAELQLDGRATPALAAEDARGSVIHLGTFAKTLGQMIGLGFVVSPLSIAPRMAEVAAHILPAPCPVAQRGLMHFLEEGHYLRHLRRTKALYAERRGRLLAALAGAGIEAAPSGPAALVWLRADVDDRAFQQEAWSRGIAPGPVSSWFVDPALRRPGTLICATNFDARAEAVALPRLLDLLARHLD